MGSTGRLCKEECLETVLKGIGGGESLVNLESYQDFHMQVTVYQMAQIAEFVAIN